MVIECVAFQEIFDALSGSYRKFVSLTTSNSFMTFEASHG